MNPVQTKTRTDLVLEPTAARVTPSDGASFRETLGRGASTLVQGAEAAMYKLPGVPLLAGALRPLGSSLASPNVSVSGSLGKSPGVAAGSSGGGTSAEGPGAAGTGSETPAIEQTLNSSQDMNLYYLELQERMATENRVFTAQSNVLKARHDTVKNAIGNVR